MKGQDDFFMAQVNQEFTMRIFDSLSGPKARSRTAEKNQRPQPEEESVLIYEGSIYKIPQYRIKR